MRAHYIFFDKCLKVQNELKKGRLFKICCKTNSKKDDYFSCIVKNEEKKIFTEVLKKPLIRGMFPVEISPVNGIGREVQTRLGHNYKIIRRFRVIKVYC
jgi:hypothetical protein